MGAVRRGVGVRRKRQLPVGIGSGVSGQIIVAGACRIPLVGGGGTVRVGVGPGGVLGRAVGAGFVVRLGGDGERTVGLVAGDGQVIRILFAPIAGGGHRSGTATAARTAAATRTAATARTATAAAGRVARIGSPDDIDRVGSARPTARLIHCDGVRLIANDGVRFRVLERHGLASLRQESHHPLVGSGSLQLRR
jgi:hypothetical protein